jgi:hypothetical protein
MIYSVCLQTMRVLATTKCFVRPTISPLLQTRLSSLYVQPERQCLPRSGMLLIQVQAFLHVRVLHTTNPVYAMVYNSTVNCWLPLLLLLLLSECTTVFRQHYC